VHLDAGIDITYHRKWPCPPIEATVGDTVVVHLTNNLGTESTGLHFHGLNQFGTQVNDGPSGATQCKCLKFNWTFVYSNDYLVVND
jgi:iron transport multicopper oxidase